MQTVKKLRNIKKVKHMLCYSISMNEKQVCVAGHESMETMQFSIFVGSDFSNPNISIVAKIKTSDTLVQDARWLTEPLSLKQGDKVQVHLVNSDQPSEPDKYVSYGSKLHPIEEKEIFCSFCGRSQHEARLIRGYAGNACDECVETMHSEFISMLSTNEK